MLHVSPSHSRSLLLHISSALASHRWISNAYNVQIHFNPTKSNDVFDYFDHLLRQCTTSTQSKQIHAQIIHFRGLSTVFLPSKLISIYTRFNLLTDAQKVFQSVPIEHLFNTIIWNSMLRANVTNGDCQEALRVYTQMRNFGTLADEFTFPLILRACAVMGQRKSCALVHCHALLMGFQDNLYVANELLAAYGKLGQMGVARQVFDEMIVRSCISWNTMVSGFAFNYDCDGAVEMFKRMEVDGWEPNLVTWTSLLSSHSRCGYYLETLRLYNVMRSKGSKSSAESLAVVVSACNDCNTFNKIKELHGYVVTVGFEDYLFVKNSLLCAYGRHGVLEAAEKLFTEIKNKSLVSWNALISLYAQVGLCDAAFSTFLNLKNSKKHLVPNVISWSAVINGFASNGRPDESLKLFRKMQLAKVNPNVITISTILSVCADLSAIVFGKEMHGYIIRNLMNADLLVVNGLINMYAKCGILKAAYITFKNIKHKDLCSWNTMIKGYGMHGFGKRALEIFKQMINDGNKPDGVTFISLLSACSHAGLVNDGSKLFEQMKPEFGIEPEIEHYACMVDLLGRAGLFKEASEVAKKMPLQPNVCVWGALLNSSRMHKSSDLDERLVSKILELSSETGNYMLMSNIYAQSGQWEESAKVRVSARERGLTKTRGQSWIELNKRVRVFTAGEFAESESKEVETLVKILSFQMKMENIDEGILLTY
ncbi:putative tetratricopeptide-like helical domain superfamily [Helianthus annuus]|nr:putative tetratricopeptide-like helical domain superfamily [Helianthus annuus]